MPVEKKQKQKKNAFGVLLADLSRAFSCLCHDLLIVKQHSYGLPCSGLFIQPYAEEDLEGEGGRKKEKILRTRKKYQNTT